MTRPKGHATESGRQDDYGRYETHDDGTFGPDPERDIGRSSAYLSGPGRSASS